MRSDQLAERAWRTWLETHRDALASSALPLELYSSRVSWEDFLASGSAMLGSGPDRREFDFNTLSVPQQQQLHSLLERLAGAQEPPPRLLNFLRIRTAANWTPPFIAPVAVARKD